VIWIPVMAAAAAAAAVTGAFLLLAPKRAAERDVRRRLSLLAVRRLPGAEAPEVVKKDLLGAVPLLDRFLARLPGMARLDRYLERAGMRMRAPLFLLASAGLFAAAAAAALWLHRSWGGAVALGLAAGVAPAAAAARRRRRRAREFARHFPDALDMLARSLRAGHALSGAIHLVGQEMPDPAGAEFRRLFEEQNMGMPARQALEDFAERVGSLDARFFVTAVLVQRETGGNLAEIVENLARVIRERFRIEGQLRIHTAQARMTGIILALLPVGVAAAIAAINPEYLDPLWHDRAGRLMTVAAVALQAAGALVIRRIVRIKI